MLTITPLPQKKAALRSCPNMKVITDLATGGDSPRRWVMLALTPLANSHQSWGKVGLKESAHGSFKTTFFYFFCLLKIHRWLWRFCFSHRKARVHPNKHTHARKNKWLALRWGAVMLGLVQKVMTAVKSVKHPDRLWSHTHTVSTTSN